MLFATWHYYQLQSLRWLLASGGVASVPWPRLGSTGQWWGHEDAEYARLHTHGPLCSTEALRTGCVVDLGHDVAE